MRGRADGDFIDLLGDGARDLPWTRGALAGEPHPLIAHVVRLADLEDVLVGVLGALDGRLLDRRELRIARERHVGSLQLLLVDARGLRNLGHEHRFGGLIGAGNRRQHARALVFEGDLLEVCRKRWRGKRPRSGEVGRREPPSRHEVVDGSGLAHAEDIALGVADPEESGALDQKVAGLAGEQDELGRLLADEHFRHCRRLDRLARQVGLDVLPVVLVRQLLEAVGQLPGRRPRALDVARLQPRVVVPQVERTGRAVLKEIPVRVDRELQVVLLDRAPDRLAIEVHDHRGRLAEEDGRVGRP